MTPLDWSPHGACLSWNPWLLWGFVVSDALIATSYFAISLTLLWLAARIKQRLRATLPSSIDAIFALFASFIVSCGVTHLVEIFTLWVPLYGITAVFKALTALVSFATALYFQPLGLAALAQIVELLQEAQAAGFFFQMSPVAMYRKDENGRMVAYNVAVQRLLGVDSTALIGLTDSEFLPNQEGADAIEATDRALLREGDGATTEILETVLDHKGEQQQYLSKKSVYRDPVTGQLYLGGVSINVTGQLEIQTALRHSRDELGEALAEQDNLMRKIAAVSQMSNALSACDTFEQIQEVITVAGATLFGDTVSGDLCMIANSQDRAENRFCWGGVRTSQESFPPKDCWAIRLHQPNYIPQVGKGYLCDHLVRPVTGCHLCLPLGAKGESLSILGVLHVYSPDRLSDSQRDLLKAMAEQLSIAIAGLVSRQRMQAMLTTDPLTGLQNRRALDEAAPREIARARRDETPLSLIFLDVDDFKAFNSQYGHQTGDFVLQSVASTLQRSTRATDLAARFGGEEMVLLLWGGGKAEATLKAEALRLQIATLSLQGGGQTLRRLTVSLGVATYPDDVDETSEPAEAFESLLAKADSAMRLAKQQGKNRVVVAQSSESKRQNAVNTQEAS